MRAMQRDKVHQIVARWMRRTMVDQNWSANEWASKAGLHSTAITRIVHPPEGEEPMIPNLMTIAALVAVAGTQPDLLHGGRRPVSYVEIEERLPAKRKAG
jgi:hypothetical protein